MKGIQACWKSGIEVFGMLVIVALLTACASKPIIVSEQQTTAPAAQSGQLQSRYQQAVQDAAHPDPDEINNDLLPIVRNNSRLVWTTVDDQAFVLVVSWVGDSKYYKNVDAEGY